MPKSKADSDANLDALTKVIAALESGMAGPSKLPLPKSFRTMLQRKQIYQIGVGRSCSHSSQVLAVKDMHICSCACACTTSFEAYAPAPQSGEIVSMFDANE